MTPSPAALPLSRRTLRDQFIQRLLWPLIAAFVLAASSTAAIGSEKSEQSHQRARILAMFSRLLAKPLWDCDEATAQGIADTLMRIPSVQGVRLHNVCAGATEDIGTLASSEAISPDLLQTAVLHRDERGQSFTVGHLSIQFRPFSFTSKASQELPLQLAIFGAMLAAMLVGAALVFRSIIGRPLARFREAILAHRAVHEGLEAPPPRFADELTDVTQAYDALLRELRRLARRDPLTDLGNRTDLSNRTVLEEHLANAIGRAAESSLHGYVLLLDLDGFKPINDGYGHAIGDFVLQTIAKRLRATTRDLDMVARLGGDEFVIVAEGRHPGLSDLIARVSRAVEAPIASSVGLLRVGVSIGAARFPEDGRTSAELLAYADEAMYMTKQDKYRLAPSSPAPGEPPTDTFD